MAVSPITSENQSIKTNDIEPVSRSCETALKITSLVCGLLFLAGGLAIVIAGNYFFSGLMATAVPRILFGGTFIITGMGLVIELVLDSIKKPLPVEPQSDIPSARIKPNSLEKSSKSAEATKFLTRSEEKEEADPKTKAVFHVIPNKDVLNPERLAIIEIQKNQYLFAFGDTLHLEKAKKLSESKDSYLGGKLMELYQDSRSRVGNFGIFIENIPDSPKSRLAYYGLKPSDDYKSFQENRELLGLRLFTTEEETLHIYNSAEKLVLTIQLKDPLSLAN